MANNLGAIMLTTEQEKKGQFKFCQRCGLYMIESFDGCPNCQTDKYIINADYGKGKTLNDNDLAILREKGIV